MRRVKKLSIESEHTALYVLWTNCLSTCNTLKTSKVTWLKMSIIIWHPSSKMLLMTSFYCSVKKIRFIYPTLLFRFSERLGWWTTSRQQEKISFQKLTPWIMIRLKQFGEEKDRSVTWNTCLAPLLATESKSQWHINGWCWLIDLLLRIELLKTITVRRP